MIQNAIDPGGSEYREPAYYGRMYFRAFLDLDGHILQVLTMEENKRPGEMKQGDCKTVWQSFRK